MSIEWIVFDLGGVVVDVEFSRFFTTLPVSAQSSALAHRDRIIALFAEYEGQSGRMPVAQLFDDLRALLGGYLGDDDFVAAINSVLVGEKKAVAAAIEKLAQQYQIACLSNTNHVHWDTLNVKFPCFQFFKLKLASHLIGYSKPDLRIYQIAQEQFGVDLEKILFFDDKPENVTAARQLGWSAYRFVNENGFFQDLQRHGIG